ncbi:gpi anchored protein [Rutstroemia sp. NJR-2017a BBW]|nr:gpi anchored protein [Rutstroemia sp. NJR-2017a BBW]
MRLRPLRVLGLPTSVLLLLVSQAHTVQAVDGESISARSPSDLAARVKDWVYGRAEKEEDGVVRRGGDNTAQSPVGVMKMSVDEGEKFFMEYWQYGENTQSEAVEEAETGSVRARDLKEEVRLLANASTPITFRAPFALHTEDQSGALAYEELRMRERDSAAALAVLEKREFKCPTGTSNCSSIGYPNSCCASDETCFNIQDTGLGPVGCCPSGGNCGGTITSCASPNTPCAADVGGGCCIPNYVCASVGCVVNPSLVVIVTTTRITTALGVVPVRPTGETTTTTTTDPSPTSSGDDTCPTGFYACSAQYQGGCCRTGRNCDTTSCVPTSSTTLLSSGITIAVPVGTAATVTTATGTCATGWSSCAASVGGDCCPSGFECGTASCSSVGPSATQLRGKETPGGAGSLKVDGWLVWMGFGVGWAVLGV